MRIALTIFNAALAVLYPVAVWWSLTHYSARAVGVIAIAVVVPLLLLRVALTPKERRARREDVIAALRVPMVVLALLFLGVVFDDARFVFVLPVLISLALLTVFGASLKTVPMIERFARMHEPELTPAKQAHCRQATWVWCGFFVVNAAIAGTLAFTGPALWWAAYAGGIAYALMGLLFVAEYVVRKARFREYGPWPHDRLLALLFPAKEGPG